MGHYDDQYDAQAEEELAGLRYQVNRVVEAVEEAQRLAASLPYRRETSLAITKLDEAAMWLEKVVSRG